MDIHLQPNPVSLRRSRDTLERSVEDRHASGYAAGGAVEVTSVGMKQFLVHLEPGTCTRFGSEGLSGALTTAANDMVEAWRQVLAEHQKQLCWSR